MEDRHQMTDTPQNIFHRRKMRSLSPSSIERPFGKTSALMLLGPVSSEDARATSRKGDIGHRVSGCEPRPNKTSTARGRYPARNADHRSCSSQPMMRIKISFLGPDDRVVKKRSAVKNWLNTAASLSGFGNIKPEVISRNRRAATLRRRRWAHRGA